MLRITTLLTCFILAPAAFAQDFDYTFAELGYVDVEVDVGPVDAEGDGYELDGSFAITPNIHAFAAYNDLGLDDTDVDLETWELGAGYNTPLTDGVDFIARASYVDAEIDGGGLGSADDDGLGVGVGIRSWIANGIELDLGLDYVDFDEDERTTFSAGLVFTVNENIAINLSGDFSDDPDTTILGLGARWNFGL